MTTRAAPLVVTALEGLPEVGHGDDLASLLVGSLHHNGMGLVDGDVLVVSSKVVSKALGLRAPDAERATVVLSQSRRVVAERRTGLGPGDVTRVVESFAGPVMAAAGVDASNTGPADLLLLPHDPDGAARDLLHAVLVRWADVSGEAVAPRLGLILSDTAGRPWRIGQTDFALGAAGINVVDDLRGGVDGDGRPLSVTVRCLADEVAAAADLVKGKDRHVAAAHLRGVPGLARATAAPPRAVSSPTNPGSPTTRWKWLRAWARQGAPEPTIIAPERDTEAEAESVGVDGARSLVRTGPGDWFSHGTHEAVRASLGVQAGSADAIDVGIPSVAPELPRVRVVRAVRLALLGLRTVTASVETDADADPPVREGDSLAGVVRATRSSDDSITVVTLVSNDPVDLGIGLGRLQPALWAEQLCAEIAPRTVGSEDHHHRATVLVRARAINAEGVSAAPSAALGEASSRR